MCICSNNLRVSNKQTKCLLIKFQLQNVYRLFLFLSSLIFSCDFLGDLLISSVLSCDKTSLTNMYNLNDFSEISAELILYK